LKFVQLNADPPLFYVGHGQAQLTDPYHLTHFARNAVLFGDSNPFDYHRWDIFKYSVASAASYLTFSLFDVSRFTANLSAVFLNLCGLLLLLLAFGSRWDWQKILFTGLILFLNSTLFFFGRYPFLENGLIFLSGLLFFIFIRFYDRPWGQILTGILIALAALSGKLFGLILLGPVVLVYIYMYRKKVIFPVILTLGSMIISGVLFLLITFGTNFSLVLNYYNEQTVGMYGTPPGFSSVFNFIKMLFTYGGESGLYQYTPFLVILTAVGIILTLLTLPTKGRYKEEHILIIFLVGWLISGILGLMPFQYRPLRYGLFLYLPMAALAANAIAVIMQEKFSLKLNYRWLTLPIIFLTLFYLGVQVWMYFGAFGRKFTTGITGLPFAFLIAIILTGLIYLAIRKRSLPRKPVVIAVAVIFIAFLANQGFLLVKHGFLKTNSLLSRYSKDLSLIVGEDAVLTGPYGATLTTDNHLRNVIYMFGLANVEKDLIEKYNITHIATDNSNWKRAVVDYPSLKSAVRVVQMPIRNMIIDIYRVPDTVKEPTDFEKGSIFLSQANVDSAYHYFSEFSALNPLNDFGRIHLAFAAMSRDSIDESIEIINALAAGRPDDYALHGFCKTFYSQLHKKTGNNEYLTRSRWHETREKELKR
jgi:4-amino-4-deoxy-L-arabinose transferase-like glycosyltransferase